MNGYISFKKVRQAPNDAETLVAGSVAAGWSYVVSIGNQAYPHLYLTTAYGDGEVVTLAVSLARLVDTIVGANASENDIWEPLRQDKDKPQLWGNSQVSCTVTEYPHGGIGISYHRRDRAPIRDWRIGQRIKNEIVGPEAEGVELYPAESRLMDEANEYHLWVLPEGDRFPFGQEERTVLTQTELDRENRKQFGSAEGAVQRDPEES